MIKNNKYKYLDTERIIVFGKRENLNNVLKSIEKLYLDTNIQVQCNILNENITYYAGVFSDKAGIYKCDNLENRLELIKEIDIHKQLDWDNYFMEMAYIVSRRATCERRKVGAVIVKDNRILSTGYNGAPKGLNHCYNNGGCIREKMGISSGKNHELCRAVHAEQNAIIQCASHGVSTEGATIYITTSPCSQCLKMLINAGIKRIVTIEDYPDDLSKKLLQESLINYDILEL